MTGYYVIFEINTNAWLDTNGILVREVADFRDIPDSYTFISTGTGIELQPNSFTPVAMALSNVDRINGSMLDNIKKFSSFTECEQHLLNEVNKTGNEIFSIRKIYI